MKGLSLSMRKVHVVLFSLCFMCILTGCNATKLFSDAKQGVSEIASGATGILGSTAEQTRYEEMKAEIDGKNPIAKAGDAVALGFGSVLEFIPLPIIGDIGTSIKNGTDAVKLSKQKARADEEKFNNDKIESIAESYSLENIKKSPIKIIVLIIILLAVVLLLWKLLGPKPKTVITTAPYTTTPVPVNNKRHIGMTF